MDVIEAVAWVDRHKAGILKSVAKYTTYTPYATEDFLQDAYEAAIRAASIVRDNPALSFNGVFRNVHLQYIFRVTPFPEEERQRLEDEKRAAMRGGADVSVVSTQPTTDGSAADHGDNDREKKKVYLSNNVSMSFPSNKHDDGFVMEDVPLECATKLELEEIYRNSVKEHLTPREQVVMEYALGLTDKGCMSSYEIGAELGVNSATARKLLSRAIDKTKKLANISCVARPSPEPQVDPGFYSHERHLSAA